MGVSGNCWELYGSIDDVRDSLSLGCVDLVTAEQLSNPNNPYATRLIEELPSVEIEALLEHARENQGNDNPQNEIDRLYKELCRGFIVYGEACLRQAVERECRLLEGITGLGGAA
jgi:hypothetical protein